MNKSDNFFEKATSSKRLKDRMDTNAAYGENDFNAWTRNLLKGIEFDSVLDVCCGTGNQLVLYADVPKVKKIVGIDISKQSLEIAQERLKKIHAYEKTLFIQSKMEDMFKAPKMLNVKFDLISCFYGLYYSQDVSRTIEEMTDHLVPGGTIMIVGPYGSNNAALFSLLEKHFKLPDLVTRSASTFMQEEVLPVIEKKCQVRTKYFLNKIRYPDVGSLLAYWKASTFYSPEHESAVKKDIESRFKAQGEFIIEKHVMVLMGRRIR